jgi:hypothetical protein
MPAQTPAPAKCDQTGISTTDPLFANPSADPTAAHFHLQQGAADDLGGYAAAK